MPKIQITTPAAPVDKLLAVIQDTRSMLAPARRCGPVAVGKLHLAIADMRHAMTNLQMAVRQIESQQKTEESRAN